ncbi:DUF1996 domain-containing protein [Streptomyces sp. NPDC058001]|uniref:DUF1996 domain-containing protein n=1 Tax=Streptomyces sp. NPDC058001 TaxID=3346300 RepID=UPI0036E04FCA
MGRTSRKRRSTLANRAIAASAALLLGGGGLIAANVYASAHEENGGQRGGGAGAQPAVATIDCPDIGNELRDVPDAARGEVDGELATLDSQITESYQRLAASRDAAARDPSFVQNSILGPLKDRRTAIIQRIRLEITRQGGQPPQRIDSMAPCTGRAPDNNGQNPNQGGNQSGGQNTQDPNANGGQNGGQNGGDPGQNGGQGTDAGQANGGQGDGGQGQGNGGQAGNGPNDADFVDIKSVQPNVKTPRAKRNAARGTFTTKCGTNQNGKFNPDNVIVAPGVSNGAHHMHDYIGNQATDAFSSDDALANGATTCKNQGDKSTYYWPVLRVQNGQAGNDAEADGGGKDSNVGQIQTPSQVSIKFTGSPVGKVVAMPKFLRIITGDAKAFVNGNANANASWSCTGFENRQLKDKYPLCPQGSQVVRTFRFQSCWDGQNTDSANHRTHVAFADPNSGACPQGFKAIPQIVQRIVYNVPAERNFAVDSFPEQLHKPVTDHGDFINVFDENLMNKAVSCINRGKSCT